jgi:hypothetical protein
LCVLVYLYQPVCGNIEPESTMLPRASEMIALLLQFQDAAFTAI